MITTFKKAEENYQAWKLPRKKNAAEAENDAKNEKA